MFKAPFSFDGRIRRIEYFLSGIIGGVVSSIAWALGVGTFVLGAASGSYQFEKESDGIKQLAK